MDLQSNNTVKYMDLQLIYIQSKTEFLQTVIPFRHVQTTQPTTYNGLQRFYRCKMLQA